MGPLHDLVRLHGGAHPRLLRWVLEGVYAMSGGVLEVGTNEFGEVVVNHPDLKPDKDGVGHIVFSPDQARSFARTLIRKANEIEPPKYDGARLGRGVRWDDPKA